MLGPVDQAVRQRALRLEQELDHDGGRGVQGAGLGEQGWPPVDRRIGDDPLEQRVEDAAELRPRRQPELGDQVVAMDRQAVQVEDDVGVELAPDPRLQLGKLAGIGRASGPHVVGLAQAEQVVERVAADLGDEPSDGGVGPAGLVAEHVQPDQVDDALALRARPAQPVEDGPRHARRRRCRGR